MTYREANRSAGWLELVDAEGNVDRPLLGDRWLAPGPSLSVRDGCLGLDRRAFLSSYRIVKAELPMLDRFARLAEPRRDPDEMVLAYARRWGLLDLCQHLLPVDHGPTQVPLAFATTGGVELTFEASTDCRSLAGREPVAAWLYWSRQAAALLGVLSRLRQAERGRPEDWVVLGEEAPWVREEDLSEWRDSAGTWVNRLVASDVPLESQQDLASAAVETWLRLAGVGLELRWPVGVPEMGFRGGGLLGALGLQILLAAVDSTGFAVCPSCGTLHAPGRSRARRRSYCEACRQANVPQQQASSRYRQKVAGDAAYVEANRLRVAGWRARRAARVGESPQPVDGWSGANDAPMGGSAGS